MDPLDFLEPDELLRFFHCNKTEMSCMEKPHTFITQLRDHNLIPEDRFKKISRMKSKENLKKALYELLDWFETQRAEHIKVFWGSVFKETILSHYSTLRLLRNSLMDGSFHFRSQLPEKVDEEETDKGKRKELSEEEGEEQKKGKWVKKKKNQRSRSVCDDDEEQADPGPAPRKKSKKLCFSSPLKKGEKGDIWTWPIYKYQLPVTCGQQEGILKRDKLAKGEKCIVVKKQWFTPTQFERFAGKQSYKNWKLSIRCRDTPLGKLIQGGHLKSGRYKREFHKAKKSLFSSNPGSTVLEGEEEDEGEIEEREDRASSSSQESSADVTDEEGEAEEQTEQQSEGSHDSSKKVFKVTCGALAATLHVHRFASGTCGKSIRTETRWMTPMEFVEEASCSGSWRKYIEWEGKPLSVLKEAGILKIHSLLCRCTLCKPECEDAENQKNDDECCICRSDAESLVVCDHCPRSFHQKCHLPHIEDTIVGDSRLWMCTFCVFKSNQEYYYRDELKMEAALSRQISQHMLECEYLLLYLCSADEEQTFATNPSLYLQDYSTVIETPTWLGSVADKLQKQLYQTVGEFVSDVQLIFTNCASYNRVRNSH
uniref:nuclear body protein SP140-like protein isoform X2 n=1 Tax=Scatophagus argus TaxID=75038 RepID=UPI001ED85013|nr:nuclear body protein SP140-like protein isoform X2 [Scatophagus argus]